MFMPGAFDLYFLGAEQPAWRALLAASDVSTVAVSFSGIERRMPKKGVDIGSWGFEKVLLDSGGFSANKHPESRSVEEWRAYARAYQRLIEDNVDHLEMVTEFDCDALGRDWVAKQRLTFYSQLDREMFVPIWHLSEGLPALVALSENYPRIGIHQSVFDGPLNIASRLNALVRRGTWLHAVGFTQAQMLRQVQFSSAASTSWLSAMRFGETLVWDGSRIVRYPARMKASARRRIRPLVKRAGLDPDLIEADDATEVTRLAIHAWKQVIEDTRRFRRSGSEDVMSQDAKESEDGDTTTREVESRNETTPAVVARPAPRVRETTTLPILGTREIETYDKETARTVTMPVTSIRSQTQRVCDTCFVADRCPAFEPGSACAFHIPIEVKTPEQRKALMDGLAEMQAQRVAFLRYAEELSGGYADPNLSQEYDRLLRTYQVIADLEDNRDIFRMQIEARGKSGALSRLFGSRAVEALSAQEETQRLDADTTNAVMNRVIEGKPVLEHRR